MRFEPLRNDHIEGAVRLAHAAYQRECRHVPALVTDGAADLLRSSIVALVDQGHGVAAMDGDRLVGYLGFHGPYEGFFGTGTGCFSPLNGIAVEGDDQKRLVSLLFQHAAESLTARGADTFAISTYLHDEDIGMGLALNGFGIRTTDAIRMIDPPIDMRPTSRVDYREIAWGNAAPLLPLLNGLVRHLRRSPTFVAADEFTPESFTAWLESRRNRFFVAWDDDEAIGYLEVTDDGENVLTTAPDIRNICGAFLAENHRGTGVYHNLLALTLATLREEGVRRIGVDFETMNPTALRFWTKHFDRYTASYARRIDALG